MALTRVHVWSPGEILTASDLNVEFNNLLNFPILLISPTTGPINFNLQAHTGLLPNTITASSASAGQALVASSTGATIWGTPTVLASQLTVSAGSTGQVLAVTSSNSPPAFQVIPLSGGLTSGSPVAGDLFYVSTSGVLTPLHIGSTGQVVSVTSSNSPPVWGVIPPSGGLTTGVLSTGTLLYFSSSGVMKTLPIGSSGQVLTVVSTVPAWATVASPGFSTGNDITLTEDFLIAYSTNASGTLVNGLGQINTTANVTSSVNGPGLNTPGLGNFSMASAGAGAQNVALSLVNFTSGSGALAIYSTAASQGGTILWALTSNYASTGHFSLQTRFAQQSTAAGTMIHGFTTNPANPTSSGTGIYFTFATTTNVKLNTVASSASATQGSIDAGVSSTAFHTYLVTVTSSAVSLTVDGSLVGSITSTSQIPNTPLSLTIGAGAAGTLATSAGIVIDYVQLISTNTLRS